MSATPNVRRITVNALWGGLIAGAVDIVAASLITHYTLIHIMQIVAGGLLGKASLEGGGRSAALGFVLQEAMGVLIALIYGVGTFRWPNLTRHWVAAGLAYGTIVYFVMNYVVVPLSAWISHPHFNPMNFAQNMAAMWVFGLIISFFARKPLAVR